MTAGDPSRESGPTVALVLAAGFGTRLRPYSTHTPKPLFTLNGRPLLDIMIRRLEGAGVRTIIVNTHHHHRKIEGYLQGQPYTATVVMRHEPEILGTGGAIRNTADIWQGRPLLVVNSDIHTDIDFRAFYRFHQGHGSPASLVLCDDPRFNSVSVDDAGRVVGFRPPAAGAEDSGSRRWTFTGIQILSDAVLAYLPPGGFAGSIEAFEAMIEDGHEFRAYRPAGLRWSDLGTPERYREVAREEMAECALRRAGAGPAAADWRPLAGDGSDRRWYRLVAGKVSMIVADHGIKPTEARCEAEAFVAIGRHLRARGLPVPEIHHDDSFAGLVFVEDLGDENLQARVQAEPETASVAADYRRVIDLLLDMNLRGGDGFDPGWAFQTRRYDREVVLDHECRYFVDAFLNAYLGLAMPYARIAPECRRLADEVMAVRPLGFMHRDFQSRNIMVQDGRFWLIDFQAGRIGPPHYDLAALLIDPYVDLPLPLREELLVYFAEALAERTGLAAAEIRRGYRWCALARNLQILGAYGNLTCRKGKPFFARFIPAAVRSLQHRLSSGPDEALFPELSRLAHDIIPSRLPPADRPAGCE